MSAIEQAWEKFWSAVGKIAVTQLASFLILKICDFIPVGGLSGLIGCLCIGFISVAVCLCGLPFAFEASLALLALWRIRNSEKHEQKEIL